METIVTIFGLIFCTIFYALYWYFIGTPKQLRKQCALRGIEPAPEFDLIRSIITHKRPELKFVEYIQNNQQVFGIFSLNMMTVVIANPELIQLVMNKEFTSFVNRRVCISFKCAPYRI